MSRLLVCPPEYYRIAYEINSWMHLEVEADPLLARIQWDNLMAVLEKDCGATLERMAPGPEVPDLVFTANAAAMAA
jgi:N-dimethylarginine dimethylaminohydrolase